MSTITELQSKIKALLGDDLVKTSDDVKIDINPNRQLIAYLSEIVYGQDPNRSVLLAYAHVNYPGYKWNLTEYSRELSIAANELLKDYYINNDLEKELLEELRGIITKLSQGLEGNQWALYIIEKATESSVVTSVLTYPNEDYTNGNVVWFFDKHLDQLISRVFALPDWLDSRFVSIKNLLQTNIPWYVLYSTSFMETKPEEITLTKKLYRPTLD